MEAHELLCQSAPRYLNAAARTAWQQDAAAFTEWVEEFDRICAGEKLLSASRMPLELIALLEQETSAARPPLVIAAFDRILPIQRSLFDAWGQWRQLAPDNPSVEVSFYQADDEQSELAACALWCKHRLDNHPYSRLLIVTQDAATRRGEIERTLLRHAGPRSLFEFSLGVPLIRVPLAKSAYLLLRWLAGPIDESEIDWLLSTGYAATPEEDAALQRHRRELRRRGLQQTAWTLSSFSGFSAPHRPAPKTWAERMRQAAQLLATESTNAKSPIQWAELVPALLKAAGWPGAQPPSSTEFQAVNRWQQAVEACASLGFNGRRMRWKEFFSALTFTLEETLFAPESEDAPIQIAGPAESAGLDADAIWFLGASEAAWPAGGSAHPFLPIAVQRESAMPHASAQLDWQLAEAITARLLASAPQVCFSFARQSKGVDARPSRLITQIAPFVDQPQPPPAELRAPAATAPLAIEFDDFSRVPFPLPSIAGGAAVLTAQSQCPFTAFATERLGAKSWELAQAGLTPTQRGQLVHEVMHSVWRGKPDGIRTLSELRAVQDLRAFVVRHVERAMRGDVLAGLRERLPRRYLQIEESRLVRLVSAWLEYEFARHPFSVIDTEVKSIATVGELTFNLRLDRIDELNDGSLLVIDYKTGNVSPRDWDLPRPDDVQLPLYAGFALDPAAEVGGLAFAKVLTGDDKIEFAGRLKDARATLSSSIGAATLLAKKRLLPVELSEWRSYIEQLAADFVAGRAEADPRDYPSTCDRCGLHTLCRIRENRELDVAESEDGPDGDGADDE